MSDSRTVARKRRIREGAWREKAGLHSKGRQVPRKVRRASKESLPRRSRSKHEQVSGRKGLQEDLESLGFTPNLAKPEMGKKVGRPRARS